MTRRPFVALLLACVPGIVSCGGDVPPSADRSAAGTAPASASASVGPAFASCSLQNPNAIVLDAISRVGAYSFSAAGFTYVTDFTSDPNSPPKTQRVTVRLDARYVAPDRSYARTTQLGGVSGPDESISIADDLWVRNAEAWESLPGGADPTRANQLGSLLRDAGPGWQLVARAGRADPPGRGCLFRVRSAVSSGGKGYRELTIRADPATGLPSGLRLLVRDAFDPFQNRHDSDVLYSVRYAEVAAIDPPAPLASPSP